MPGLPRPRPLSLVVTWVRLVLSLATTYSAGSLPTDPFFLPFLLSSFNYFLMFSICAEKLGSNGDAQSPVQFLRPLPLLNTPGSYPGPYQTAGPEPPGWAGHHRSTRTPSRDSARLGQLHSEQVNAKRTV